MYKYVAASGLGEYIVVGNNLRKLRATCAEYAKEDYANYLECCEYLEEAPTLTIQDFTFADSIEAGDYNVAFALDMAHTYDNTIHEI